MDGQTKMNNPTECDIVMEGGVTSGVVYPSFVTRLARNFTLRCIGGTSVGAVAAVVAAAAQFRRNATGQEDGFDRLAGLPRWLSQTQKADSTNLFRLFKPCAALRAHFALMTGMLNRTGTGRIVHASTGLLRHFPLGAFAGLFGAAMVGWCLGIRFPQTGSMAYWQVLLGVITGVTVIVLAMLTGSVVTFVITLWRGLERNRCGICSGMTVDHDEEKLALTPWLHDHVQAAAGLSNNCPLTFGMLEKSEPSISLAFMTTGLTEMRAHRLPFGGNDLVFRVSELTELFPETIVSAMVAHAQRPSKDARVLNLMRQADPDYGTARQDLYALPTAEDLPVVFAARLSLSFPILLQAVPLHRIRYVEGDGVKAGEVTLAPIWLSDGGLTSNFPIHFFDELLPVRPTFGIALSATLSSAAPASERVSLPDNHSTGLIGPYEPVGTAIGKISLFRFGTALLATIRCWRDEALRRTPGYRDRIVQIRHTPQEGGLNLNMPPEAVAALSDSGAVAADLIVARFCNPIPRNNGWLQHRWVRMRSTASVLQTKLATVQAAYHDVRVNPSYAQLWDQPALQPGSYPLCRGQRDGGTDFWRSVIAVGDRTPPADLSRRAPRPQPTLEIVPKER